MAECWSPTPKVRGSTPLSPATRPPLLNARIWPIGPRVPRVRLGQDTPAPALYKNGGVRYGVPGAARSLRTLLSAWRSE